MNETDMIVRALQMGSPVRRKRKVMKEVEPSPIDTSNDAISRMAEKPTRKKRSKPLRYWEVPEFLQYLVKALSDHGVQLERVSARDREDVAYLYDELIRRIGDQMSNAVMRDYIDWWTSTHARKMYGSELCARSLSADHCLDQFVQIKFNKTTDIIPNVTPESTRVPAATSEPTVKDVDSQTLYRMGGLPMLLRAKGLVVAAQILRDKEDQNWIMRLSQALHDFPKEAVVATMERTVASSPYKPEHMVDFISIARPALEFHRVKDYSGLNYQDFFKS